MHRIETDPMVEPIQKHLQELAAIPRINFPLRLHIVVSYDKTSGKLSDAKITKHESSLRSQMESLNKNKSKWQLSMHQVHFQGEPEEAWRAVEELLKSVDPGSGPSSGIPNADQRKSGQQPGDEHRGGMWCLRL